MIWAGAFWILTGGFTAEPARARPAAPPPTGRHFLVQVRIIEVDEAGRQTVLAQPVLQTTGAASGVSVHPGDGRRLEFHFAANDADKTSPLAANVPTLPLLPPPRSIKGELPAALAASPLDRRISLKLEQQPRREALTQITRPVGLKVLMDPATAAELAAEWAQPVTLQVDGQSVRSALERLLEPVKCGYSLDRDYLVLERGPSPPIGNTRPALATVEAPPARTPLPTDAGGEGQVRVYGVADLVTQQTETGKPDFRPLLETLQTAVTPESWEGRGGKATIRGFDSTVSVVIRHTPAGHAAIAECLSRLRSNREPLELPPLP